MATFKVGQRVRINCPQVIQHGAEGTIVGEGAPPLVDESFRWHVDVDGFPTPLGRPTYCKTEVLIPLTDPRAEEFIGDMERFASITKPKVPA